jgi:hypothetical protein
MAGQGNLPAIFVGEHMNNAIKEAIGNEIIKICGLCHVHWIYDNTSTYAFKDLDVILDWRNKHILQVHVKFRYKVKKDGDNLHMIHSGMDITSFELADPELFDKLRKHIKEGRK